jgi:hypothetical protein
MSDPKEVKAKDDLDLDTKVVQDLEPDEKDAEDVRGGFVKGATGLCKTA